jgi:hypothetical protein
MEDPRACLGVVVETIGRDAVGAGCEDDIADRDELMGVGEELDFVGGKRLFPAFDLHLPDELDVVLAQPIDDSATLPLAVTNLGPGGRGTEGKRKRERRHKYEQSLQREPTLP